MNRIPTRFSSPLLALFFAFSFSLGGAALTLAQNEEGGIQQAMTPEQFKASGLEKLSPTELASLNAWLQGDREKAAKKGAKREKLQLTVSRVDGVIQSIGPRQVIPLEDGSQWEITNSDSRYQGPPKDHPAAAAFKSLFGWKIRIAGVGEYYVVPYGRK